MTAGGHAPLRRPAPGGAAVTPDPEILRQLARGSNGGAGWAARACVGCHDYSESIPSMLAIAQPGVYGGRLPIFWIKGEAWRA